MATNKRWHVVFRVAFAFCFLAVLFLAFDPAPSLGSSRYDKLNHVLAFFCLGVLLWMGWPTSPMWKGFASLMGVGICIEIVQHFVGRDASLGDLLANAAGLMLAALAGHFFRRHWLP